jgi:hypothetical protein
MRKGAPRVVDNDRDEITVMLDGREIRGWSYANEQERRVKMLCAREFVEGWHQAETSSLNRDLLYSYRGILKAVGPVRQALQIICDDIEDEGDRAYFGSTNQADSLKEITQRLEDAEWSEVIEPLPKVLELDSWKFANEAYELRVEHTRLKAINAELLAAMNLALEYWSHRQQRYKNRHPVWVQAARAAIAAAEGRTP